MREVAVIGAGVVGLSCAAVLAERGHAVTVVAPAGPTASDAAAALWMPAHVERSERVRRWAFLTLAELRRVAVDPASGVREQASLSIGLRPGAPDPWLASFNPSRRPAGPDELPEGYVAGSVAAIPLVDTSRHLPWLRERAAAAGAAFVDAVLDDPLDAPGAGAVVVAAGIGAGRLVGDPGLRPVRGRVLRLANPGLRRTLVVRDGPLAPLSVVPRLDDVVLVGPSQEGEQDEAADLAQDADVLRRAVAAVPALAAAAVLGHAVGLRPVRSTVRLEREDRGGRPLVHCYGHGGAGIATGWGSALDVAELVAA